MPTFGFSTTLGYISPTYEDCLAEVIETYNSESGIILDTGIESPTLDLCRTKARQLKGSYDDGAGTYASGFVGTAEGAALRNKLLPFIGPPLPDSYSTVVLPLDGTALTVVGAGSTVRLDSDGAGSPVWTLLADVTLPDNGTFQYALPGPKSAAAASTWSITTPAVGWTTAGPNVADAERGRLAETDNEYRSRYGLSTLGARMAAAVSAVDGVTAVNVFENPTDIPDSYWGATHWIEMLVQGGAAAAIAAAIQSVRAPGVQTLGTETEAVSATGYPGGTVSVRFSRPAEIDVYVELAVTPGEGYSTDTSTAAVAAREAALKTQILTWAGLRKVGLNATLFQVAAVAAATPSVPGIDNITGFIGIVDPPVSASVVAGPRDLLVFAEARIEITGA